MAYRDHFYKKLHGNGIDHDHDRLINNLFLSA